MKFVDRATGAKISHMYSVIKYCGGVRCGDATNMPSIDSCIEFANDGFCDYCRITCDDDGSQLKIHFTTPEQETHEPSGIYY